MINNHELNLKISFQTDSDMSDFDEAKSKIISKLDSELFHISDDGIIEEKYSINEIKNKTVFFEQEILRLKKEVERLTKENKKLSILKNSDNLYDEIRKIWKAAEINILHEIGEICPSHANYEENPLDLEAYFEKLQASKVENLGLFSVILQRELLLSAICQFIKRNTQKEIQEVEKWIETDFIK